MDVRSLKKACSLKSREITPAELSTTLSIVASRRSVDNCTAQRVIGTDPQALLDAPFLPLYRAASRQPIRTPELMQPFFPKISRAQKRGQDSFSRVRLPAFREPQPATNAEGSKSDCGEAENRHRGGLG